MYDTFRFICSKKIFVCHVHVFASVEVANKVQYNTIGIAEG